MQEEPKTYIFFTDSMTARVVEEKGNKEYFISGYISTKDRDIVDDIVTEHALSNMLSQLSVKSIKLDVEHEAWATENPTIIPIGKIIEAKKDERGIFIKATLNSAHSRFNEVWSSIKNGYLDAFSIAYKASEYTHRMVDGIKTRILNKVDLLNVAITGNPVNPECRMTEVFVKSLSEANKMTEEIKNIEAKAEPTEDEKKKKEEEDEEEKKKKDSMVEQKAIVDENKSLNMKLKSMEAEIKSLTEKTVDLETKNAELVKVNIEQKALLEKDIHKATSSNFEENMVKIEEKANPKLNPLDMI